MKIKQITIVIACFINSSIVIGATYGSLEEQLNNSTIFSPPSSQESELTGSFFNEESYAKQKKSVKKQDYIDIFNLLLKKSKLKDAENKINILIKQNPKDPEFYNLRALLETLRKNYDLAIKSYQNAIALDQQNLKAHIGLTILFLETGNVNKAKEHAAESLSINDKSIHAYFLLAKIANKENRQQDIENLLLTAQEKNRGNIHQEIAVARYLARFYDTKKQTEKALILAQELIKRYPGNKSALSFLAGTQLLNNQKQPAIQTLEQLINQETSDLRHRLLLIKLLINQPENEEKVLKLLNKITAIAPDDLQILTQKTAFLTKLNHFSEAFNTAQRIKQLAPETGFSELLEGDIYLAEKKPTQALTTYQQAYKIKPNTKILNTITNIMLAQGKESDAISFLNKELKKNPKNLVAHFKLASIYEKQKNANETEKHYQAILVEQPNNALVLNNLAWLYYQQNDPKALPLAEKAYQKISESPIIADTYGSVLVKQGQLAKGMKILKKASLQVPNAYAIQYHLANAYAQNGNRKLAIKILSRIINSQQSFPEKNAASNLLKKLENN